MSTIRFDRLRDLEAHLREGTLLHDEFDFSTVNGNASFKCGTSGCAIGELPFFAEKWGEDIKFGDYDIQVGRHSSVSAVCDRLFGISRNEVQHLFMPDSQDTAAYGGRKLDNKATRYDVADNIAAFIEKMEKEPCI